MNISQSFRILPSLPSECYSAIGSGGLQFFSAAGIIAFLHGISMSHINPDPIRAEWLALHQDHERYDRWALLIKLLALLVWLLGWHWWVTWPVTLVVALLWGQEAIWRTWQARLGDRLLAIEQDGARPFRFYREWQGPRPGMAGLVLDYVKSALRPTVVYPYAVLLMLDAARKWWF